MTRILSNYSVSISELKLSPAKILQQCNNEAIAILNHNKPSAYLIPTVLYEKMLGIVDDYYLAQEVEEALSYKKENIVQVDIDAL